MGRESANSNQEATFLDLSIKLDNGKLTYNLYDKRNDFNFNMVRFPDMNSNIHLSTLKNVTFTQILRSLRVNSEVAGFCENVGQNNC